jgi:HK97 family phage major capsid protein/HK97 family phage prohead protease
VDRAYSLLHVKSVDDDRRMIRGMATTPAPDRTGDIVEPLGAAFPPTLPLLLHHRKDSPVGTARFKKPTSRGIEFEAEFPVIDSPGIVRDRVNEAWDSVKAGLIRGVSIGFRPLDDAIELLKTGGLRFLKTEILELSLVTVPANAEATLALVKSLDASHLAATGPHSPGVTGSSTVVRVQKDARPMTTQEQITSFEAKRAANVAAMTALMTKSEGSTLDEAQREEYTTLEREVESIDEHLPRLKKLEKMQVASATAITQTTSTATASSLRGGETTTTTPIVKVATQLPKGTSYTRYIMALAGSKGDSMRAIERAKQWIDTPEVELMVKAAVAAGTTTTSGFAAELAIQAPQNDFIELLRPKTLLGRIPNLRRVPFNVSVPAQTAGGTYAWVGQGKPKPLTSMTTATVTLAINKIAGIIVLTEELVKISSPSAEELVRNEMIAGIVKFMDEQFIDPSVAASGTVSPASITNGTTPVTSAGTSADNARTDVKAVMAAFVAANLTTANAVWIMSEANAFALATAVTALGQPAFPGMSVSGGTLFGIPVVATQSAGTTVALVDAQGILVADDGGVNIDVSREASLQMDSAPTDPVDATTVLVSMFQQNLVALRAERFVTWKRARTASVKYVAQSYV